MKTVKMSVLESDTVDVPHANLLRVGTTRPESLFVCNFHFHSSLTKQSCLLRYKDRNPFATYSRQYGRSRQSKRARQYHVKASKDRENTVLSEDSSVEEKKSFKLSSKSVPKSISSNGNEPNVDDSSTSKEADGNDDRFLTVSTGLFQFQFPRKVLLYFVPFLWGSFNPSVRYLYSLEHAPDGAFFSSSRLIVSAVCYAPFFIHELMLLLESRNNSEKVLSEENQKEGSGATTTEIDWGWLRGGTEMGVFVFFATFCQVVGLETTSAGRAAFLNQLQTVMVPLICVALGQEKITKLTAACSVLAITGVALLSGDSSPTTVSSTAGDAWQIASALFFSLYVIRVGTLAGRYKTPFLVGMKIFVQMILSVGWGVVANWDRLQHLSNFEYNLSQHELIATIGVILWTGIFCSAVSAVVQTTGQKGTPASETALILSTQPLWASALAAIFLSERFGPKGILGGALILSATALSARFKEKKQ
uniref:EamA domain-containing protein n=1 Tax=Timspurckia oligopyrenoides TaxID=708627 RepID=A0A7S0ZJN1_9RHOD